MGIRLLPVHGEKKVTGITLILEYPISHGVAICVSFHDVSRHDSDTARLRIQNRGSIHEKKNLILSLSLGLVRPPDITDIKLQM